MRKKIDDASILLGSLTLGLTMIAGNVFFREYRIQKNVFAEHPGILLLILIILVMLFQILVLFHRKRERGRSLIFADLNSKGFPEKIFEVAEQDVIRFCKEDFGMVFRVEYWPNLRRRLLDERKRDTSDGRIADRLYCEGCAMAAGDFVALLEYTDPQGRHVRLSTLERMPTPADGALEVIRANFLKTRIFQTPLELVRWEYEMAAPQRTLFRNRRNDFLRQREKEIA